MRITRRAALLGAAMAGVAGRAGAATPLMATWNGWPESQVKPLFDAFNKTHPEIQASYELIPFSQVFQTLEVRLGARTPEPDIYSCDSPLTASYAVRGQAMALDDVLDRSQFAKSAADAATFRGKLYSAPFSTSSQFLFYNRAYFRQAGIEPPAADVTKRWTWEQVVAAGRKMADPAANRWGLIIEQAERPYQLLPFGQSLGGVALSEDGLKASGYIDGPAFVEGFGFMQRLYTDWKIAPQGVFDNNVTPDLFGSGRSAMFLGGTFNLGLFADKYKDLDWGVAPHPYFEKGKPVTPTGSWHIGVNPRTKNRDAVAKFVQFMCGPDAQLEWFKLRPYVPVRRDVWERLPEVFATPPWQIIRYEVDNTAVPRPATPGWREYEDLLRQTLRDMQTGGDVKAMLSDTAAKIDRQLAKYRNA
ncbi:MAG TPA: sugar ABC transporter substrate-binding protein [Acetobacteraceae bacterium]|jgi:multiple sugar transport system substrate-binding protein|nr:sugar ABC transporter substrate-binding protein [Acetobacteraceae bacterium]